jgi:hypothetical protein
MKTFLVLATSLATAVTLLGQGRVQFANTSTTPIRTNFVEAGVSGAASGAGEYVVGLFLGPAGSDFSSLQPVAFAQSSSLPGRFSGGANLVLPVPYDGSATIAFQVRAWSAALGPTWADASEKLAYYHGTGQPIVNFPYLCGSTYVGCSAIGFVLPATGVMPSATLFGTGPGQISGLDMYNAMCPEPSVLALGGMGLAALLVVRHCRSAIHAVPSRGQNPAAP